MYNLHGPQKQKNVSIKFLRDQNPSHNRPILLLDLLATVWSFSSSSNSAPFPKTSSVEFGSNSYLKVNATAIAPRNKKNIAKKYKKLSKRSAISFGYIPSLSGSFPFGLMIK